MTSTITLKRLFSTKHTRSLRRKGIKSFLIFLFVVFFVQSIKAQVVYAVSASGNLISFNASSPGITQSSLPLTGITPGQILEGLDFRPATGQLYGLGYNAVSGETQVYTVKIATGVITRVGAALTLATAMTNLSFDFNPTVDRIRLASKTGQNYRLNPNNGALVLMDGTLTYAGGDVNAGSIPQVVTVGYTNSFEGATSTTLYFYDFALNILGTVIPPNSGTLNTIGSAGLIANNITGLDLDIAYNRNTGVNTAYLSADVTGIANNFYTINLATGATTLTGAIGGGEKITEMAVYLPSPALSRIVYAASNGNLITFNSSTPATILSTAPLSGFAAGETILGMDFRPATGQLYALGSGSRIYTINITTGVASQVGSDGAFVLNGTKFGFDFNPVPDRIRVVSDLDQNLRLNPNDGTLAATDGTLAYAAGDANVGTNPTAGAVAYTNSYGGATSTTLYFYDYNLQATGTINPPNNGTMNTTGSSGIAALAAGLDMDIATDQGDSTNTAFLAANLTTGATNFYRLNLLSGAVLSNGVIGGGFPIDAMAIYLPPAPPLKVVYAISTANNLVAFNSTTPGSIISTVPVTGVAAGQTIEGLDFRPANNQLYAFGYNGTNGEGQLYTLNAITGVATLVGDTITLPLNMGKLSVDFNPMVDRLRIVGSTGQNFRVNPNDGLLVATDIPLSYAAGDLHEGTPPVVHAAAYTNNFAGTTSTSLYYYDYNLDKLAATLPPTSPNAGFITTVGISGVMAASGVDLDITSEQTTGVNTAFLVANVTGTSSYFYTLNLATGEARMLDTIGSNIIITEMAVSFSDVPLPVSLTEFVVKKAGLTSQLSWVTQNELNNQYFMVERSQDGRTFKAISEKINSQVINGNSNGLKLNYAFTDVAPVKGINYYRLLQADKDGSIKYSQVLKVTFDGRYEIRLYPNPVKNSLNITGYLPGKADLSVKLTDASGRIILIRNYKQQQGVWNAQVNVSGLQTGVYYIQITEGKNVIHTQPVYKD